MHGQQNIKICLECSVSFKAHTAYFYISTWPSAYFTYKYNDALLYVE